MVIPPQYDEIHQLAVDLVNASECGDTRGQWELRSELEKLCQSQIHPFPWETLGDFTSDAKSALGIYSKALQFARDLGLTEYLASIQLAMAERYLELGEKEQGMTLANQANEFAKEIGDLELRSAISQFLLDHSHSKMASDR